jgi:RNA polymerase sigma-70 factor (ECF subfamily)
MTPPTATEQDPLERLVELVRTQRRALVGVALAEGATPEEAVECVQDALCTFLRVEREGNLPAGGQEQVAAVFTMVRNATRNLRRRHHRRMPHAPLADDVVPSSSPTAEELIARAEDSIRLRACLSELCTVQRAVITLRLLEERSGEDVAATLGLSRGYVDVLVHRARSALGVCMRAER